MRIFFVGMRVRSGSEAPSLDCILTGGDGNAIYELGKDTARV